MGAGRSNHRQFYFHRRRLFARLSAICIAAIAVGHSQARPAANVSHAGRTSGRHSRRHAQYVARLDPAVADGCARYGARSDQYAAHECRNSDSRRHAWDAATADFNACIPAGATFAGIEATRQFLMSQAANTSPFSQAVFRNALVMTLALQSQIITGMRFRTQAEIENMLLHMRGAFDAAKVLGIDEVDVNVYQTLNAMGGALMNFLARTELQLPRFMTYQ